MTRCWLFYRSAFSRFSIIYNYDQERQGTQDCMDNTNQFPKTGKPNHEPVHPKITFEINELKPGLT